MHRRGSELLIKEVVLQKALPMLLGFFAAVVILQPESYPNSSLETTSQEGRNRLKALVEQGNAYRAQHRFQEAEDAYKRAIEESPEVSEGYCQLGDNYGDQGKYVEAEKAYKRAIELEPRRDGTYVDLGDACVYQNKFLEAENAYKKALDLNPENRKANFKLGLFYDHHNRLSEGVEFFEKIVAQDPGNNAAKEVLDVLCRKNGKSNLMEAYRKKA